MCELTQQAYEQDCKPLAPIVIDLRETSAADALRTITSNATAGRRESLQQEAKRDCERAIQTQGDVFKSIDAFFSAARKRP